MPLRHLLPACLRDPYIRPRGPRPRPPARLIIPHARMTDEEWHALEPHLPTHTAGRPCDLRAHFDAFFRVACTEGAWRELPEEFGKPDTVSRHFPRLTHAGLWERLLRALAVAPKDHILRRLEGYICRAARRAIRLRGLRLIWLARRLDLKRALPGPPWMVADPDLSEIIKTLPIEARLSQWRRNKQAALDYLRGLKTLHTLAGGRRYLPRPFRECWP
ncbi:transposase [Roseococcus sp. SYP-B2431]|uniref:transposase n=1 Tax=Roseococcus sp. SYP-B2431 TaxID=2496640 RepID=UPI00269F65F5